MIQRVQTIYLFMVFIFALLFLLFPKANIIIDGIVYQVKIIATVSEDGTRKLDYLNWLGAISRVMPILIMLLTLYTTFLYKNRLLQIKMGKINILLHLIMVVSTFFYLDGLKNHYEGVLSYGTGVIFPLIAMVFILMANRAIRRDEELVRSADRLR